MNTIFQQTENMEVQPAEKKTMIRPTVVESEVTLQPTPLKYLEKLYQYWGHVIVVATFVLNFMFQGIMFNYNLLFLEFGKTFDNATTVEIGLPGAVSLTVFGFSSPIAAFLFSRAGHRTVLLIGVVCFVVGTLVTSFITNLTIIAFVYGSTIGFAADVAGFVTSQMIVLCFKTKHVSLSTGIGFAGAGAGLIVGSPVLSLLYGHFGWRNGLRIIAGVYGIVGLICSYFFYLPQKFKQKHHRQKEDDVDCKFKENISAIKRMKSLVKCPVFWPVQIVFFVCMMVIQFLFISVGNYMKTLGVSDGQITLTMTLMGVGDLVGRLLVAFTSDRICVSRTLVYAFNSFFGGMLMFYLLIPQSAIVTSLIIAGVSLPRGIVISMMLPVIVELFGKDKAVEATSIAHIVTGFASLVGPVLSDSPFDKTGSYNLTIFVSGILFVFAGLLTTCVEVLRRRGYRRKDKYIDDEKPYQIEKQQAMLPVADV